LLCKNDGFRLICHWCAYRSFCGGGFLNLLCRCWAADGGVRAYSSASKNKGGHPRFPPTLWQRSAWHLSSLIWPECQVPKVFAGELQMDDMPNCQIRCVSIVRNCVFLIIWFQREWCEALRTVAIMVHVLVPW
jgi:hypothetical protein